MHFTKFTLSSAFSGSCDAYSAYTVIIACDRIFYRSEFCTIFVIIPADKNVVLSIRCRQAANQGSLLYFTGLQFTSTFCIECNLILFLCFIVFVILSCDDIYDLIPKIRFFVSSLFFAVLLELEELFLFVPFWDPFFSEFVVLSFDFF
mgnify:CR=1 FL=1